MSSLLLHLRVFAQLQRGLLAQYGWWRSWRAGRPVDGKGNPIPWITYPAIDFLSQFDYSNADVFEWGSGSSTLWWSKRARHVVSVESDAAWVSRLKPQLPASVELIGTPLEEAAEVSVLTDRPGSFDVIVVDNNGPFRKACATVACSRVRPGGFIIVDNSDMCLETCAALREFGFMQIDFTGFAPANGYAQTTSVFVRDRIGFPLLNGHQPMASPAQPNSPWPGC